MDKETENIFQRLGSAVYLLLLLGGLLLCVCSALLTFAPTIFSWLISGLAIDSATAKSINAVFSNTNGVTQNFLLNLAAGLVGVTVVYFVVDKAFGANSQRRLVEKMQQQIDEFDLKFVKKEVIHPYPTRESVYNSVIDAITKENWKELKILAPVGLWDDDAYKKRWLETLAQKSKNGSIETLTAIFGLPPMYEAGVRADDSEIRRKLAQCKEKLLLFDKLKSVGIRYYPPSVASIGFGVIVFVKNLSEGLVAFAMTSHSYENLIDTGFSVDDEQVFAYASEWFSERLFNKAVSQFVLQDERRSISETWDEIVKRWYGQNYL